MGRNKHKTLLTFLKALIEKKGNLIPFEDYLIEFKIYVGADEDRTVKPYLKLALELGYIEQQGNKIFLNVRNVENGT